MYQLNKAIENLQHAEYFLQYGDVAYLGKSQTHENILLDKGCELAECDFLEKGVHSALDEYIQEVMTLKSQIEIGNDPDIEGLRSQMNDLLDKTSVLRDLYIDDIGAILDETTHLVIIMNAFYVFLVLMLFFFMYVPVLNRIQREITSIWNLGRLIPISQRAKIIRSLKNKKLLKSAENED